MFLSFGRRMKSKENLVRPVVTYTVSFYSIAICVFPEPDRPVKITNGLVSRLATKARTRVSCFEPKSIFGEENVKFMFYPYFWYNKVIYFHYFVRYRIIGPFRFRNMRSDTIK